MLRPLLEQAADPIHQYRSGNTSLLNQIPQIVNNNNNNNNNNNQPAETLPSTVTIFKSDVNKNLE